jgi:hypothetical protein
MNTGSRFDVFTVTMKNAAFWDVAPCGSCENPRFGGTCHLHLQGGRTDCCLLYVSSRLTLSLTRVISSTLKMEASLSSETSVYNKPTGATSAKMAFFIQNKINFNILPWRWSHQILPSFTNRTIADWNRLPEGAIGTSLVKTHLFRKRVRRIYFLFNYCVLQSTQDTLIE